MTIKTLIGKMFSAAGRFVKKGRFICNFFKKFRPKNCFFVARSPLKNSIDWRL